MFDAVFATSADRLVLVSPQRRAALVVPNSGGYRWSINFDGGPSWAAESASPFYFNFNTWFTIATPKPDAPPFKFNIRFATACMLSFAHAEGSTFRLQDGIAEIRNREFELRIDLADGRPLEVRSDALGITLRTEQAAFPQEMKRVDQLLAQATAYDAKSPWKSALEFLLDESADVVRNERSEADLETFLALRKLVDRWALPAGIVKAFRDAFPESNDGFWLPCLRNGCSLDEPPGSPGRKNQAGLAVSIYRRLVPKTGWIWPVGRDALLFWGAPHPLAGFGLHKTVHSDETGPVGELVLSWLSPYFNLSLDNPAECGRELLFAGAFSRDCRPLTAEDSWLGRCVASFFEALKALDERELESLVRLVSGVARRESVPESARSAAILRSLLPLRESNETPIAQVLPDVFDGLWRAVLRDAIKIGLGGPFHSTLPLAEGGLPLTPIRPFKADLLGDGGDELIKPGIGGDFKIEQFTLPKLDTLGEWPSHSQRRREDKKPGQSSTHGFLDLLEK